MTIATVDLGKIKFQWKGDWSSSASYTRDDVVHYQGQAYVCKLANTNSTPAVGSADWDLLAAGGDPSTIMTTQGDLLVRGSVGLERLPVGSDGQVLVANSGSVSWGAAGMKVNQINLDYNTSNYSSSGTLTTCLESTVYTRNKNSAWELFVYVPARNDDAGWGGIYVYPQVSIDGSGYHDFGHSGYSAIMNSSGADIGYYSNTYWMPFNLASSGTIQFRIQFRPYSSTVWVNRDNNIGTGSTTYGNWQAYQNYTHIISKEYINP